MKKAIIITAVLFVLSSLTAVFSAVSLGVSGISQLVDYVEENGGLQILEDGEVNIDGYDLFNNIKNGNDFSIIGNPDLRIGGDSATDIDVSDKTEIKIHADVGKIYLKSTSGSAMTVTTDIYSSKSDVLTGGYELKLFEEEYDVYLKSDKRIKDAVCALTVELPEGFKGKVTVTVDTGELEIQGVVLSELEAEVDVGEINAESAALSSAVLSVDTGEIDIDKDFICVQLTAKTQLGSVEYEMPTGRFVEITYSVETGSAETDGLEAAGFTVTGSLEAGLGGVFSSGEINGSNGTTTVDTVFRAHIEVGIGGIEFDVQ